MSISVKFQNSCLYLLFCLFQTVLVGVLLITVIINILFIADTGRRLREAQFEGKIVEEETHIQDETLPHA